MRITFNSLSWQNFLSAGNVPVVVDFTKSATTLVVGKNGAGKSTIITALLFALFGSAHRDGTKKTDLVNWLIGQECKVELEFDINGTAYRIVRGIAPNLFDIYRDGEKLSDLGNVREQQAKLETDILRFGPKAFQQIVILGKANYVPFMKLEAAARRAVVEDLLDIGVFTRMAEALKPMVANVKADRVVIQSEVKAIEDKLRFVDESAAKMTRSVEHDIERCVEAIAKLTAQRDAIVVPAAPSPAESEKHRKAKSTWMQKTSDVDSELRQIEKQRGRFTGKACPTCGQKITDAHKKKELAVLDAAEIRLQAEADQLEIEGQKLTQAATVLAEQQSAHNKALMTQQTIDGEIKLNQRTMERLKAQVPKEIIDRTPFVEELEKVKKKFDKIDKTFDLMAAANRVLKDDGIRASVVRRYLPILNSEISRLLNHFGLNASFKFDETFNETIRSRYIHAAQYGSFSQGEQLRMELALLFTWRRIAQEKASLDTNLLIMDEILDSSLDAEGCTKLLAVLQQLTKGNTFVISHRSEEEFQSGFGRILSFEKHQDFSRVTERTV